MQSVEFNSAYQVFRGLNKAGFTYSSENYQSTKFFDLASNAASETENKSGITIGLEDFTDKINGFHDYNSTNITQEDAKKGTARKIMEFFGLGGRENIFESEKGQSALEHTKNLFQNDLFHEANLADGGLRYAKEGEDRVQSALNFAKADIKAIEKAFSMVEPDGVILNGKLDYYKIASYSDFEGDMSVLDLDGKPKKITPEEYASYILAADGMKDIDNGHVAQVGAFDGIITEEEAQLLGQFDDETIQSYVKNIYEENFD